MAHIRIETGDIVIYLLDGFNDRSEYEVIEIIGIYTARIRNIKTKVNKFVLLEDLEFIRRKKEMKYYKLKKDIVLPGYKIPKGSIKSVDEWTKYLPGLNGSYFEEEWFEEMSPPRIVDFHSTNCGGNCERIYVTVDFSYPKVDTNEIKEALKDYLDRKFKESIK